jgi:hypothetical protein
MLDFITNNTKKSQKISSHKLKQVESNSTAFLMTLPVLPREELQHDDDIILYKRRWVILTIYGFASFLNATLLTTFAPISTRLVEYYNLTEDQIDLLSLLFIILFLPGIILSIYISRGFGFSHCFKIGALLQTIGTMLRLFIYIIPHPSPNYWYTMMFIGQFICGLSQPLLTSISTQLAKQWFASNENIAAQFIGSLSNPLGIAMGALFSRGVVDLNSTVDRGVQMIVIIHAVASGGVLLLGLMYFEENPPTPPTLVAKNDDMNRSVREIVDGVGNNRNGNPKPMGQYDQSDDNNDNDNDNDDRYNAGSNFVDDDNSENFSILNHFITTMKPSLYDVITLLKDNNFLCIVAPFGLGMTVFNAMISLPNKVIGPFTEVDASNMTATIICVGLISCVIYSILLEITKKFRLWLKLGYVFAVLSICLFFTQLNKNISQTELYFLFSLLGFCMIPLLPLAIENALEMTWGAIPPQIVSAVFLSFGQLPSIPMLFLFMSLLKQEDYTTASNPLRSNFGIVVSSLLCIALVLTFFYSGDYKRQAANKVSQGDYMEINDDDNNNNNHRANDIENDNMNSINGYKDEKSETKYQKQALLVKRDENIDQGGIADDIDLITI